MRLERSQLIKAIKFLKPAILASEAQNVLNFVHVKIQGDVCRMTTSNDQSGKRVFLNAPQQLAFDGDWRDQQEADGEFLIEKATLESFETLCQKHKNLFERAARADHTLNFIEIGPTALESHKDVLNYVQPPLIYPNIDDCFYANKQETDSLIVDPGILSDAVKEFPAFFEIMFSGKNGAVFVQTLDETYQAFFKPVNNIGGGDE